ncbi:hypothetical protein Acr_07g0011480 [Actinidia rufa]|uniref:Uncharacterized protein n=1 Tax=Actinidia rufa TaxID=165716 RepID=A0A7J0EX27_9ERIC|nr:hypothetical protein Acr_07g0011480 [Actinidia rufa]
MNPNNHNNMNNQENVQAGGHTMMDYLCPNTMARESPIHVPVQAYGFEIKPTMLGLTSEQRQFVEALSNGRFLSKTPEEAWDYFDELAANNQTWEMAGTTEPTRATGKYILHDVGDDDVRTQLVKLTRQLEMLTTKKVHEMSTKESHTQALNDIRSHLSKLTTSMGVAQNERGKFPSQPQPNPQGQHSIGSSNDGHMEHLKAVTTLRSGREVDKTIYPKVTNTTGLRTAPIPSYAHEGVGVRNNGQGKNVVKESVETPTSAYHPPAPFSQRLRAPKKPNHNAEIYKLFEQVKINIPLLDAVKQILAYAKFLKDLCTVKRTLNVKDKAFLMEQVSSIIQAKTAPKYKDPGCPTVSIIIGATTIEHALLDLGASVNLLPYTVYKKLGLGELKPTSVTLQLADRSVRIPRGIIEDVLVQVDKFYFPADFIVLDTQPVSDPDAQIPVILGRPFLATSDAIIQCRNGRVKFSFGNLTCDLKIFDVARQVGDEGSIHEVNYIDTIVQHHIDTKLLSDPLLTCLVNPPTTDYSLSPEVKHIYSLINVEEVQEIQGWIPKFENLPPITERALPSNVQPPKLELKPLPSTLKYTCLGADGTFPVIISSSLNESQESQLLALLKHHREP